jgi:manganese/zinc/iron transport system substrate-binding protein
VTVLRRPPTLLLALLLTLAAAAQTGCGAVSSADIGERKVRVAATTNFIADTVEQVGGDRVDVTALMGPGVDPHLYKASADDVGTLREADVVFYGGLQLEGKMQEVLDALAERQTTVAVTEEIPRERLLDPPAGTTTEEYDPHVWFDPSLWRYAVAAVRDTLVEKDPGHADLYRRNARHYLREIDSLERESREALAAIPERQRVLVTSHDAFRYFGRAFDVDVTAIQGISTAAEATTADIRRVAETIAERDVRAVFVESSVPRQTIEAVLAAAADRGAQARIGEELYSDAAGSPGTPEGTYLGMVRANVERMVDGLAPEGDDR